MPIDTINDNYSTHYNTTAISFPTVIIPIMRFGTLTYTINYESNSDLNNDLTAAEMKVLENNFHHPFSSLSIVDNLKRFFDLTLPLSLVKTLETMYSKLPSWSEQPSQAYNFITSFHKRFFDKFLSDNIMDTPYDIYKELPTLTAEVPIMTYTKIAFLTLENKAVTYYTGQPYDIFTSDNIYYRSFVIDFISAIKTLVCYSLDLNYGTKKYSLSKVAMDLANGSCKLGGLYLIPGQVFLINTGCEIMARYLTDLVDNDEVSLAIAIRKGIFKNIATKFTKELVIDQLKGPAYEAFKSGLKFTLPEMSDSLLSKLDFIHIYENLVTYLMTTSARIAAYESREQSVVTPKEIYPEKTSEPTTLDLLPIQLPSIDYPFKLTINLVNKCYIGVSADYCDNY